MFYSYNAMGYFSMNIAVVGFGNVGSAISRALARAGHHIFVGVRDDSEAKLASLEDLHGNIAIHAMEEVADKAAVVVFCVVPTALSEVCKRVGPMERKLLVDTMNSLQTHPMGYSNTYEVLSDTYPCCQVIKAFSTTGFENILHPNFGGVAIDTFMAGGDREAKAIVRQLAKDIGFDECYDFGGKSEVNLLEELARIWVNLALYQGYGRLIAFKLVRK